MKFEEAIKKLQNNKKVTCSNWKNGQYLTHEYGQVLINFDNKIEDWEPHLNDLVSDWEVVEEKFKLSEHSTTSRPTNGSEVTFFKSEVKKCRDEIYNYVSNYLFKDMKKDPHESVCDILDKINKTFGDL